jgi:hypothetical protein
MNLVIYFKIYNPRKFVILKNYSIQNQIKVLKINQIVDIFSFFINNVFHHSILLFLEIDLQKK